jgi:hypothetical protein
MASKDSVDDSSSLPIANLSSLLQDTLFNVSSCPHVVDENALIIG